MRNARLIVLFFVGLFSVLAGCSGSGGEAKNLFEVMYDQPTGRLHVILHPGLPSGNSLFVRVRNGRVGVLDCFQMDQSFQQIDANVLPTFTNGTGERFEGPSVDPSSFVVPYTDEWIAGTLTCSEPCVGSVNGECDSLASCNAVGGEWAPQEPTQEMINLANSSIWTIDLCLMDGIQVVRGAEMDVRRALDREGTGKFDGYSDGDEAIESVTAYARECVKQLGEIPFFPKLENGDYQTYSCLDSVPIPTTFTDENGLVAYPEVRVDQCDNPQFIYSLCEPNAVSGRTNGPRVASRSNEQGTEWVLLCRKSLVEEGIYNDIAMVGHNPYTGKTCYFQNALYAKKDGLHVPHPADEVDSPASPEQSESLWSGIQGGIGSGIQCVECHDSDPFIHTPWIDGALDERGDPVIPKMGVHEAFPLGFNEAPYTLVDLEGQGWTMPKHLVDEEAAACTKCHRIGDGRWAKSWIDRLVNNDTRWVELLTESHRKFEHVYWMPPEMEGVNEETWDESEFGKATNYILACMDWGTESACGWEELPTEQIFDQGELPEVALEGPELAAEALKILGADIIDPADPRCTGENGSCASRRCAECHSVSKNGLKHWRQLTNNANNSCGLNKDIEAITPEEAMGILNCLRSRPEDPESVFAAEKVGVFTTGAGFSNFRRIFQKAYGDQNWLQPFIQFKSRVMMPKGTYPSFSQEEHATVIKWFNGGLKHLNELIIDPPPPASCEEYLEVAAMNTHIDFMKFEGWGAVNKENNIFMYGCLEQNQSDKCFSNYIDRTKEWSAESGSLKELAKLNFKTSFWTRSSADGRFVGNGGGAGSTRATITDLVRQVDIGVKASYDPGFFPDNSGFIYQGGGTNICLQSILHDSTQVDFDNPACMKGTGINLYQHVARGLNGGDYFIINSQFTSDAGTNKTRNPLAHFNASSTMKLSPMVYNGTTYEQLKAVIVDSPFEGDAVLSPSGGLVVSRLAGAPDGGSWGYVIRKVVAEKFGDNYQVNIDQVLARICAPGAKANISYDERFMITHTYENNRSNIYLWDLKSGQKFQVTNMPEGSAALFPHFRSDNWFYFLVRDESGEYIVASDLAVILGGG